MHRTTTLLTTTLLLLGITATIGVDAAEEASVQTDLTTIGEAIIGFEPGYLPALKIGDHYLGAEVVQIVEQGHFIVVAAERLDPIRAQAQDAEHIAFIEDNGLLHALYVPDDTRYSEQWGPATMGFHDAWDDGLGTNDIIVAVLDTGIRKTHNDFTDANIMQGYDYSNGDNNPNDDCGHGTHVSGTVGATTGNALGVAGMSQASIMHMKVLSPLIISTVTCSGSNSDIADAIYDATDLGARVISMSLGGASGATVLQNAVDYAWNNNVVVVAAAGNENGGPVGYPAAYSSVIAVSAIDSDLGIASYSSVGPQVEVTAPGSGVLSTYNSNDNSYSSLSGTSMATPHVAGAIALAFSAAPATTAATMRTTLQETAQDLGAAGRDNNYGYGLVRVDALIDALGGGGGGGNNAPTASFTASTTDLTVDVDGSGSSDSDGTIASYAWDFGDGATATGATASHTYAADGTYTITLTVTDNEGATGSQSQSVSVATGGGGGPDPDPSTPNIENGVTESVSGSAGAETFFKIEVPADATSLSIVMTGPSCGVFSCPVDADLYVRVDARPTDSSYNCRPYDQGNDETCNINNPAASWWYIRIDFYSGSGTVSVTATHDGTTGPVNNPPTATFSHSATERTVDVDGSGSSDSDGTIASYAWDFGDGATATGATASHTYAADGTYTVTLTVTDDDGATDQDSQSVTVAGTPPPNQTPTAAFTHASTDLQASFDGASSSDPDGTIASWAWDFGDGATGSGSSTTHTYASAGTYTVTLTVTDDDGATDDDSQSVTVTAPPPNVAPTAAFATFVDDLEVTVDGGASDDSDGSIVSWAWDFGDGTTGSGTITSHTYAADGTYTVTLTVTDDDGATDATSQSVTVAASPDPDPSTPTVESGQTVAVSVQSGADDHFKVYVPAGTSSLSVAMSGPSCGLFSCPVDADLYVRSGQRATDAAYDCRPYTQGNAESCDFSSPAGGWWYIRIDGYSGSGNVSFVATVS